MPRRLAVLLALLVSFVVAPSAASAAPRHPGSWGGGATATTIADVDPSNDDGGGAESSDLADDPGDDTTADDAGVDASDDGTWSDDDEDEDDDSAGAADAVPVDPAVLIPVPSSRRTVKGRFARLRTDGRAAIPRSAPKRVKRVLAAANLIVGKPYKWGGGHSKLFDSGYDCSGAVGYALIRAGLLDGAMVSGTFARWAVGGPGKWLSIHANKGHVYMEVAGLRLDTSPVGDPGGRTGVRWRPVIGRRVGFHTRHVVGL